jgi:hypothetical protein
MNGNSGSATRRVNDHILLDEVILHHRPIANGKKTNSRSLSASPDGIIPYFDPPCMIDFELQVLDDIIGNPNILTWDGTISKDVGISINSSNTNSL